MASRTHRTGHLAGTQPRRSSVLRGTPGGRLDEIDHTGTFESPSPSCKYNVSADPTANSSYQWCVSVHLGHGPMARQPPAAIGADRALNMQAKHAAESVSRW